MLPPKEREDTTPMLSRERESPGLADSEYKSRKASGPFHAERPAVRLIGPSFTR